jgi:hypothetical protein
LSRTRSSLDENCQIRTSCAELIGFSSSSFWGRDSPDPKLQPAQVSL